MHRTRRTHYRLLVGIVGLLGSTVWVSGVQGAAAATKPASEAKPGFPYVGEVTGDAVYVRSMPDQNWYPTTKVSRGSRLEVHADKFGWLKILPPRGSFCYVDKNFIISEGGGKGVVRGDNVYVRAGSEIEKYERQKNCVVAKLSKGAEVRILGEHPDGYYKIAPPPTAFYWISGQFVRKVGEPGAAVKPSSVVEARPAESGAAKPAIATPSVAEPIAPVQPSPPRPPADLWQKKLDLVEAELTVAFRQKPWKEQVFRELRQRFVPIAQQDQEDVPREYAKIRIRQIDNDVLKRIAIRSRLDKITGDFSKRRQQTATQAAPIAKPPARPDYEGKLVRSFAFEGRYRIVDRQEGKTLVYLEFPPDSGLDANQYVGRFVKVRVKEKRFDKDARRNVVVPAEIVVADEDLGGVTTNPVGPPVPSAPEASANKPAVLDAPK